MCGITGFWQPDHLFISDAASVVAKMADRIIHRGPDETGVWFDAKAGIALAHRRLSILELSQAGHQPMLSACGRYQIVFNGEIYNHLELRKDLPNIAWRGHSDTETLLAAFAVWGVEDTLKKSVGMFAIALWDSATKVLTLARDRIGEKPLYYGFQNDTLLFGSELKALKAHPDFLATIDRDALCLYLRHSYIPAPYSIYKGIKKLPPGQFIQFCVTRALPELRQTAPQPYWSLSAVAERGTEAPFNGNDQEAINALEIQLKQAIKLQMVADVPLGAFLSGGVDSSTIVALMQSQSTRPIKTFTIGFEKGSYNEAVYAKAVAKHLGTEHTEHYVSPQEALEVIPQLGSMYDEPFADSSQIPTFLVARMARQHVTVSLSGDAGDELFCGYNRYLLTDTWRKIDKIPFPVRRFVGRSLRAIPLSARERFFQSLEKLRSLPVNMSDKLEKFAVRLEDVDNIGDLYYSLVSEVTAPEEIVLGAKEPISWLQSNRSALKLPDPKLQMMFLDGMTYLPDDILVKVDRAAMANSLETRVPFLDHRLIELAWSLPLNMKMRNSQSKWIIRQILYKYVPKELIERPKMGFGVPVGDWMRGPLKDWAEDLLSEKRLQQEGFFDVQFIRTRWQEHLSGKRNWLTFLWTILMFQLWINESKGG